MTGGPGAARAWLHRHPRVADAGLALVVLAVTVQPLLDGMGCGCAPAPAWGYGLAVLMCLPLVWRRRWPFAAGLAAGLLAAVFGLTSLPEPVVAFAALVGIYSVAAHGSRRVALASAGIAAVAITLTLLLDRQSADAQDYTVNFLVFATAWLLGDGARSRRERAAELEARIDQAEQMRVVEAERALAEERTRIARELHDVVAHAVSLMVVQAEAGPVVVHRDPDRAVRAFDTISSTGKQALTELRQLLGLLRTDPADRLAPQPTLAALPALVDGVRRAGLPVELAVEGPVRPLPAGVELAGFRIVQEALTNTLKHAGPVRARVLVRYDGDVVELEVRDDGAGGVAAPSGGNGLVGMRERAGVLGGTVSAGPVEGGWRVHARLPVPVPVAG